MSEMHGESPADGGAAPDDTTPDDTAPDDTAPDDTAPDDTAPDMELYDIRVVVDRIEGRSVCGMSVGDCFEVVNSAQLRIPGSFCLYALSAVLPLIPAKQRALPPGDWLERDQYVACPDPDERLIMRIERGELRPMRSTDLT